VTAPLDWTRAPDPLGQSIVGSRVAVTPARLQLLLSLEPGAARRLQRGAMQRLWPGSMVTTSHIREVGWDTTDFALGRLGHGLTTEIDEAGRRQAWHDLRTPPAAGRLVTVTRQTFTGVAPVPPIGVLRQGATLMPIFGIEIERWYWRVEQDGTGLDLALEIAVTSSTGRSVTACSLSLECRQNAAAPLYEAANRLRVLVLYRLAPHDRLQAAYRSLDSDFRWPRLEPALSGAITVRAGIGRIGRVAAAGLRTAAAGLEDGVPEAAVHKTRVAARRLRSVLSVFRKALPPLPRALLSAALYDFARLLGEAREADVWLRQTVVPLTQSVGSDAVLQALMAGATARRNEAAAAITRHLAGPTFMALLLELGRWFDAEAWPDDDHPAAADLAKPFGPYARKLLTRRDRKLLEAGNLMAAAAPEALHEIRIMAKKQRYAAELLATLFDADEAALYIDALKRVQDLLGTANDAAVGAGQLAVSMPADGAAFDPLALARTAGMITGWSAAEGHSAKRQLSQCWQAFVRCRRFWE
jgi:CHAD domain-containing protein